MRPVRAILGFSTAFVVTVGPPLLGWCTEPTLAILSVVVILMSVGLGISGLSDDSTNNRGENEMDKLDELWVAIRDYFDVRNPDAGVKSAWYKLLNLNARINVEYLLLGARAQFLTALAAVVVILLLAHSSSALLATVGTVAGSLIMLSWGLFVFSTEFTDYEIMDEAEEEAEDETALDPVVLDNTPEPPVNSAE